MAIRDDIQRLLRELSGLVDDISDELIVEIMDDIADLDADDSRIAKLLVQLKSEINTELLNEFQRQNNEAMEGTDPDGYVYLGPDDRVTRPFCEALVGKWLTREEIDMLDNQQMGDCFVTRGGFNCRHSWHALYGAEQLAEFTRGNVAEANAAAGAKEAA